MTLLQPEQFPACLSEIVHELRVRRFSRRGETEVICTKAVDVIEWLMAEVKRLEGLR